MDAGVQERGGIGADMSGYDTGCRRRSSRTWTSQLHRVLSPTFLLPARLFDGRARSLGSRRTTGHRPSARSENMQYVFALICWTTGRHLAS